MKIVCKLKRPDGTLVTLDGVNYHFKPSAEDVRHCAIVEEPSHQKILLAIREAYHSADKEPEQVAVLGGEDPDSDSFSFDGEPAVDTPVANDDDDEPQGSKVTIEGEEIDLDTATLAELKAVATTLKLPPLPGHQTRTRVLKQITDAIA
jgi:hypothetical protein